MNAIDRPLISIIMPVFNAEGYVACAIESILNQTYYNIELLVLDDASSDGSLKVVESYTDSRIRIFKHDRNQGYLKSVNYLLTQSKGDFIAFQDADDWSEITRLEFQLNAFKKASELKLCGTQCTYSKSGRQDRKSNFPLTQVGVLDQLDRGDTVVLCGASIMLKRELVEKYGGYRKFFDRIGAEHLDWFYRMLPQEQFANLPQHLYTYRMVQGSFTKNLDLQPLKYHSTQIALLAYWQRKLRGVDVLSDENGRVDLIKKIQAPYDLDKSLIYKRAGFSQLAFGQLDGYLWCVRKSIGVSGLTLGNIKFIFIWLPLFIFQKLLPQNLQRKVVERNNHRFLKRMGIDTGKL